MSAAQALRIASCVTAGVVLAGAGSSSTRATTGQTSVAVYLVHGRFVTPVRRILPFTHAAAHGALAALLRGPTVGERRDGYETSIPRGTSLRGVTVARGVATVDLSRRFEVGGGSESMLLRVAQVVMTATQFPSVERVAFRLDDHPVAAIGGEGVVVSPPVGRGAFETQTPPIAVEQPLPGDRVGSTFTVRGTANVFEARLIVEARGLDGTVLARRHVLASAGSGTRGTFRTRLRLAATLERFSLVVYATSPKNGRPIDIVRIPVRR